jgi:hypothetical protein
MNRTLQSLSESRNRTSYLSCRPWTWRQQLELELSEPKVVLYCCLTVVGRHEVLLLVKGPVGSDEKVTSAGQGQ